MKFITDQDDSRIPENVVVFILDGDPAIMGWSVKYNGLWYGDGVRFHTGVEDEVLDILLMQIDDSLKKLQEGTYENTK